MKWQISETVGYIDQELYKIYRLNREGLLNPVENRIHMLYQWLHFKPPIYPWMWDHENYTGKNKDMIGFFYPEDLANLQVLKRWQNEYQEQEYKRQNKSK